MTSLQVLLSGEALEQLREMARQANVTPEELARVGLEDWLRQPREDFLRAARHVLEKNAELYSRLA
jgi:antitoxin FitA